MAPRKNSPQGQDYRTLVKRAASDERTFLRLTLSGRIPGQDLPYTRITVRPVLLKAGRRWQFAYFKAPGCTVSNVSARVLGESLDEVLALPFSHVELQSAEGNLHVRLTRKGKVLVTRGKPAATSPPAPLRARTGDLAHNRPKSYLLPPKDHREFLQAIGIADARGEILPTMQDKFAQVNEFLRIIDQTVSPLGSEGKCISMVDCGCGSAYLTFAVYHFLHDVCGLDVRVASIDVKGDLIDKCVALRDQFAAMGGRMAGWRELEFAASRIADYTPAGAVDVVLSLHACDTATDGTIAQGVRWASNVILAAPCCQHELQHQLKADVFRPLLRHGILRERLADLLTDTFRALALRIMGYRTDVIQFVDPEHTAKNLLIRAEKGLKPGDTAAVRQYRALKEFWGVTPVIEEMVGDGLRRLL